MAVVFFIFARVLTLAMTIATMIRMITADKLAIVVIVLLSIASVASAAETPKWSADPPVTLDFDMQSIPEPKERSRSFYYDFLYSTFGLQVKEAADLPRNSRKLARKPKRSYNLNVLDKVPDSSWFTNRNAKKGMSLEEIKTGPNRGSGPAAGTWTVIQGKTEGITPGFLIRDARGDVYQLKFDPPEYPEMTTAAEVIASKFYYAAGYNVKENYLVLFHRARLALDEQATIKDRRGRSRRMMEADVDAILALVARRSDGTFRAVAGKYLEGIAKGPFAFEGVRKDDPNDWMPHEHRRDLRGLRVLASWVNENDFREGNTLDMYVEEDGRRFLRHYLIDFGSSLGSDTIHPNIDRIGNEHQLDLGETAKSLFSFGLYRRPWHSTQKVAYRSVGFLESDIFDPGRWKANYPVLPFENMTLGDAFWGTRLVLSFTDEQIRAAVETGEFTDPGATDFLTRVLIQRRDKIARYWLSRVSPLGRFEVWSSGGTLKLAFKDLEVEQGFVGRERRSYEFSKSIEPGGKELASKRRVQEPLLSVDMLPSSQASPASEAAPRTARDDHAYQVSLRTLRDGRYQGGKVDVYLLNRKERWDVVGIDGHDR